jgi:hypothetical protein
MQTLLVFLANTPWWVFLLLALLIGLGVQALRPRAVALPRVFITPAIFLSWGLVGLALRSHGAPVPLLAWSVAAAVGAALALTSFRPDGLRLERGRVHFPGSPLPLARNLLIFLVKYALAVAVARSPDLREQLQLWDIGVSGVIAGYFIGWMARFVAFYRRANAAEPALASRRGGG